LVQNEGTHKIVAIDPRVLRAFLNIRRYEHGARSIEAILKMSQLSGKTSFERSSLPSETQLDLHVNGREFTALVNQLELNDSNIEIMAKAFHHNRCDYYRAQGYVLGPENSEEMKTQSSLMDYDKLPDNEKMQNRNIARYLFDRLGIVGYIIVTNRNDQPLVEFQQGEIEILAEMEHLRWMNQKFEEGWKHEKTTNNALKLHADLLPWEQLTNASKENDRVVIRDIPKIVASAGYNLFKLN
ncbi:MAG TPA: RyR domain-containing protein, partial [Dehalococcoidales bacterium]